VICHPERSEGSAFSFDCITTLAKAHQQILRYAQDDNIEGQLNHLESHQHLIQSLERFTRGISPRSYQTGTSYFSAIAVSPAKLLGGARMRSAAAL